MAIPHDRDLWTPPKHIYRAAPASGQLAIPGIGIDHPKPQEGRYVKPGSGLYRQRDNPHVWGKLAGHHNPFFDHELGDDSEHSENAPESVHEWEQDSWEHPEGYEQSRKRLQRLTDHSVPLVNVSHHVLHKVLDDGRLKGQLETNTSNGALDPGLRTASEARHFGYPDHLRHRDLSTYQFDEHDLHDMDDEQREEYENRRSQRHPDDARPIYGTLAHSPIRTNQGSMYGEHKLVLHKPSVWHRTTVTFGDSLNDHKQVAPSPVQNVSPLSFNHTSIDGEDAHDIRYGPEDSLSKRVKNLPHFDQAGRYADSGHHLPYYAEAQFHGGVKTSDIHYAILSPKGRGANDELKYRLTKHKIPWVEGGNGGVEDYAGRVNDKYAAITLAVESYIRLLGSQTMGQVMVVAQQGPDRFLLSEGGNTEMVRLADTSTGTLSGEFPLQSFLGRGYWEDPEPGVGATEILALVKPAT